MWLLEIIFVIIMMELVKSEWAYDNDMCDAGQFVEDQNVNSFILSYMSTIKPSFNNNFKSVVGLPFLEDITKLKGNIYEAVLNFYDTIDITFKYIGSLNVEGLFHGPAILEILDPATQCIQGKCTTFDYQRIQGNFNHGVLDGMTNLTSHQDLFLSYLPIQLGILHGIVVTLGLKNLYPIPPLESNTFYQRQKGIGRIVEFVHGKLSDRPAWQGLHGNPIKSQGFLYGTIGKNEKMSGDNVAYIYPGKANLALIGKFKDNIMISGRKAVIQKATCRDNLITLEFSSTEEEEGPEFYLDPATNVSMGSLHFKEPYEELTTRVATSKVPNAGQGLFAVREIQPDEVIAFYNGLHFAGKGEVDAHDSDCLKKAKGSSLLDKERSCFTYKIYSESGELLNIPPWFSDYDATSGHKVNNKFPPFTNAIFGAIEHPRFGAIVSIVASKFINTGEEIYVNYGYNKNTTKLLNLAPWYDKQFWDTKAYLAKIEAGEIGLVSP